MKENEMYSEIYQDILNQEIRFRRLIRIIILIPVFVGFEMYDNGAVFAAMTQYLSRYTDMYMLFSVVVCILGTFAISGIAYHLPVKAPVITQEKIKERAKEMLREEVDPQKKKVLGEIISLPNLGSTRFFPSGFFYALKSPLTFVY